MAANERAAAALLYREARLLDERAFEDWLALFTEDAVYYLPGGDGTDPDAEVPILYDDRATLEDRVLRLRSPVAFAQSPPSETVHVVTNLEVEEAAGGGLVVHSALVVHEARLGLRRVLAARCLHRLRPGPDGLLRIAYKEVRLVDRDRPQANLTFIV